MGSLSKASLLSRVRRGKESRQRLVMSNLDKGIAFQIRATRERQNLTQIQLAQLAEMKQNNISRLESPDYGKHTLASLKRLADALDVALVVRFVPFSQYTDWLSGTPHWEEGLRPEAMSVPSFAEEENFGKFQPKVQGTWELHLNPYPASASPTIEPIAPKVQRVIRPEARGLYQAANPVQTSEAKVS